MSETERKRLFACRRVIRDWKGSKSIILIMLSDQTGIPPRQVEALVLKYHLNVRRFARETTEELSDEYLASIENFHLWCNKMAANFRKAHIAALREFMAVHEFPASRKRRKVVSPCPTKWSRRESNSQPLACKDDIVLGLDG
jgi:hypothetical protein